jgi:hypothetical protein
MRYSFFKIPILILVLGGCVISPQAIVSAAELDDIYTPLLNNDRMLYTGQLDYFELDERGVNGGAAYGEFDSVPYFSSINNTLRASILPLLELKLGYKETLPADYGRFTYSAQGPLSTYQEFDLKYFRDINISGRMRKEPVEIWVDFLRRRHKSGWNLATIPNPTNYYVYNKVYYDNVKGGIRYLLPSRGPQEKSNLSIFTRPLMEEGQSNIEVSFDFEEGRLRRLTDYYLRGKLKYNYFHYFKPHLTPSLLVRYGMSKDLELETGISYTTPFRYKYVYENYTRTGTSNFVVGNYRLRNNFYFPIKCRYRPCDNLEIMISSDFNLKNQRLDYWQKTTNGSITNYSPRELTYYNFQPTMKANYLFGADKTIEEDELSSQTGSLLKIHQFLIEFQYKKDLTFLDKNQANGDQNIIDYHNLFLYPLDFFVGGTEYAGLLTGNYTRYAENVIDQNYHLIETSFTYGITDNLNAGAKAGYRSGSSHKNFTLHDRNSHYYKVNPYYFFDLLCNWRLTENSLLSFKAHVVPEYTAQIWRSGDAKGYKAENNYFKTSLALHILY